MDPEPDMLVLARRATAAGGVRNISWLLGADADVPSLGTLLGLRSVAAVTIGTALHWMSPHRLFPALLPLLRDGGGIAVLTNGLPLWSQDTAWSRALYGFLHRWLGRPPRAACGTDAQSQRDYRHASPPPASPAYARSPSSTATTSRSSRLSASSIQLCPPIGSPLPRTGQPSPPACGRRSAPTESSPNTSASPHSSATVRNPQAHNIRARSGYSIRLLDHALVRRVTS
jgi:hypothetical protein